MQTRTALAEYRGNERGVAGAGGSLPEEGSARAEHRHLEPRDVRSRVLLVEPVYRRWTHR